MAKYTLELNEVQAQTVSQACEFFARIKMGQFDEIPFTSTWNTNFAMRNTS